MSGPRLRVGISFVLLILGLGLLGACSSDGNPTAPPPSNGDPNCTEDFIWVHHMGDSLRVCLEGLPSVDIDGLAVVHLNRLVSEDLIPPFIDRNEVSHDTRALYSYQIEAEDGYSAHGTRGYPNNAWDQMEEGYIVKSTMRVRFPESLGLPGAYSVRDARRIHVWRKIDLHLAGAGGVDPFTAGADTTLFYELRYMEDQLEEVTFPPVGDETGPAILPAIPLAAFILQLVENDHIQDPSGFAYHLTAIDGYGTSDPLTWDQLQTGYWLPETMRTRFTDPDLLDGRHRLGNLERITVQATMP